MAKVEVQKKKFTDEETGRVIDYERLVISSYLEGEYTELELKLERSELQLAKLIMRGTDEGPTTATRRATDDEIPEITRKPKPVDNFDLFED